MSADDRPAGASGHPEPPGRPDRPTRPTPPTDRPGPERPKPAHRTEPPAGPEPPTTAAREPTPETPERKRATGPPERRHPAGPPPKRPAEAAARKAAHGPARPGVLLDEAHLGEIQGAFGRVPGERGEERPGFKARLLTLLAIVGPGIIVMVGDNDAGGVATYAQAGQNYGYSLLWVLLLLIPVLIVNQEMVVRLGAVTGVGHARLITERFGRFWGWFSVGDLFLLNFLTIVTEFIGVSLAAGYLGVSQYVVVPVAAVVLVAVTASGSFRRWERAMFAFIGASLLLIPLTLMSGPRWGHVARAFVVPGVQGGVSSEAVLLIIAIVGTTVAPWQLFFQQSNVIDKRITPRFIGYERTDTVIGSVVVVAGAAALIMIADFAARGTAAHGHFTDAAGVADALGRHDPVLGVLFAIVLLDASIIGAAAVTLATSYAFGDVFNLRHSLHRSFGEAKRFYGSYSLLVLVAAAIVLIPGAPLGLITEAVQALAGLLLPSASVFLLLLCNDTEVLGPWVNPRWLNVLATVIIAVLLMLSGTLMATTLFPAVNVTRLAIWLAIALVTGLIAAGVALRAARRRATARPRPVLSRAEKLAWRMPPLALLRPVRWSAGTRLGMMALRGYLLLSALLLLIKAIRLGSS
ncbi:divalent metal cation transporter [Streptomyces sp. NPDC046942]|uniref:divalent metal cation transporter n=1 Tax=Streptomyces sp. NPDC046942 TaxID=3155137 RepID=UPI00340F70B6